MRKILDVACIVASIFGCALIGMYVCAFGVANPVVNVCGTVLAYIAIACLAALAVLAVLSGVCYYKVRKTK
ncbi:MAG: hypothetical protein IJZ68_06050 [Bacteroidaceae bacterium]|nr:hypothetical protein [Bacteroidaceae bacterium]